MRSRPPPVNDPPDAATEELFVESVEQVDRTIVDDGVAAEVAKELAALRTSREPVPFSATEEENTTDEHALETGDHTTAENFTVDSPTTPGVIEAEPPPL